MNLDQNIEIIRQALESRYGHCQVNRGSDRASFHYNGKVEVVSKDIIEVLEFKSWYDKTSTMLMEKQEHEAREFAKRMLDPIAYEEAKDREIKLQPNFFPKDNYEDLKKSNQGE